MLISTTQLATGHVNRMQNMKLTASNVQEMSLWIPDMLSVGLKNMHKLKITGYNQLEIYSNGFEQKFSIEWLFCFFFLKYYG